MSEPRRIAIVGAGPAGFFTVEALLKTGQPLVIDLFNRYPPPYGLVRDGVAPDHAQIKSVTRVYKKLLERDEVRYWGNVTLGEHLTVEDLRARYHQIVYAFGAQSDRSLGIPGEDLEGSVAATAFVGWYNGHPAYRDVEFDLSTSHVVVVGNGNVAIDVARILVLSPDVLASTDIADHALEALRDSAVRKVTLLGRRGPAQAAFTNPELKEFGVLDGVSVEVEAAQLELDPVSRALVDGDRGRARNLRTLEEFAESTVAPEDKVVRFRFLTSPVEILGEGGRVSGVRIEQNELVERDGVMRPSGTGRTEVLECGMVLRSVGYRGQPVGRVPYDDRTGRVPNVDGRVTSGGGEHQTGEYVVGWAKRGPTGVIGTNKADASGTVAAMNQDWDDGLHLEPGEGEVDTLLKERGVHWVDKAGWFRLDRHEVASGEAQGRPRIKVCTVGEMLEIAGSQASPSPGTTGVRS